MIKIKSKIKDQPRPPSLRPPETLSLRAGLGVAGGKSKFKTGFAPLVLIIIIGIVLAAGGLGLGLAWKAGLFGKPGGGPTDETTTNGTQPTPPPSNGVGNGEQPPPPPDIPTDWKTYTSDTYGYSVRYPSDWEYYVGSGGDPRFPADAVNFTIADIRSITVAVEDAEGLSAKEFGEALIRRSTVVDPIIYEGEVLIGGLKGFRVAYTQETDFANQPHGKFVYSVVVWEGKAYYFITAFNVDPETGEILETEVYDVMERKRVYDLMQASLKFTG